MERAAGSRYRHRRIVANSFGVSLALLAIGALTPGVAAESGAEPRGSVHGIAMHGAPALADGFKHFPYVNPDAPKGGRMTLGVRGAFDSLNPFTSRGVAVGNVRSLVFESLLARSADEPFTLYGLIARRISLPDDRSEITFHLDPAARFSDGKPITSADVLFSHDLLKTRGPFYMRSHYGKVVTAEAPDARTVRFTFAPEADREIPLILGMMPILPKHALDPAVFDKTTLKPMVGSGPYVISNVDAPQSVTFSRNPDYWASDHPARRGMFNADTIKVDYYRDATALFEAFKTGAVDFRFESEPARWADGYQFAAVTDGRVKVETIETGLPAGMNALVFNTRRPVFADPNVRRGFIALFDFKWINGALYNGQFA
ncbi:MAG: extracellular solute-binding protein, partial [Pseudomonadota bacterium]